MLEVWVMRESTVLLRYRSILTVVTCQVLRKRLGVVMSFMCT